MQHDTTRRRKTRAAREIGEIDETQEALAERWGVTVRTLQRWLQGDTSPRQADRERICLAGGPRPEAWDDILPDDAPRLPPPAAPPASREGTRAAADAVHAIVVAELDAASNDALDENPGKRLQRLERLTSLVVKLGDLTGAAIIDEKRIAASPAWERLRRVWAEALRPWPEALAAATEALERAAGAT